MATSKPSIHLKEKSGLVSSTNSSSARRPTSKSSVPNSPEREAHPPQRTSLIRSSSDTGKRGKTLPQQPSTTIANVTRSSSMSSRLPAKKPVEKPPSPSRQLHKQPAATTSSTTKTLKTSSSMSRASSISSKPSDKATNTLKTPPSIRARSPGGVVPKRKDAGAAAPRTVEEPVVTAEPDQNEAETHVEEHQEPVNEPNNDIVKGKASEITDPNDVVVVEEHVVNSDSESPEQHEPSSLKQDPESPSTEDGNGDHDDNEVHDNANEEFFRSLEEKPAAAEITEEPQGEQCETEKIEAEAGAEPSTTTATPEKTEANAEESEPSTTGATSEKIEAPETEPSTAKIEADAEENKAPGAERSTAVVMPEKEIIKPTVSQGKKEDKMGNEVIEETRSKLLEKKKSKVRALVGAFETVISLQDPEGGQSPEK